MQLRLLTIILLLILLTTGCNRRKGEEGVREVPVMKVTPVDSITIDEEYAAVIEGRQDVDVYPQISGKITRVCVQEGEEVKAGQLLFVIDQVPYKAAVSMATANVHVAESQVATARLERDSKKALYEGDVVSEYELETARNAVRSSEATLEQARAALADANNNLSYTEICSPADGVVGMIPHRVGTLVSPQMSQPLISVSDNAEMWVYFSMSEKELQSLMRRYGSRAQALAAFPPVRLTLSDGSPYRFEGTIENVSGVVNRQTGTVQIKTVFPNPSRRLLSGSTGNIVIPQTDVNVILVPINATYEIQDKIFVYKVKDGKADATEIKVAPINDGNNYIVRSGLSAGDFIVTEGVGTLRDGQQIRIRDIR